MMLGGRKSKYSGGQFVSEGEEEGGKGGRRQVGG